MKCSFVLRSCIKSLEIIFEISGTLSRLGNPRVSHTSHYVLQRNDMGGRYCAINSPRGSRWGQKSRDRRSRDFCPHRGPSGELIAPNRPPMSFCFYPTLYLGNHLYFFKPDSSWKQQKNTLIDSVHSTKRVVMDSPHKGQWRGTLMFSLICAWTNGWANNRYAGDLRRHRAHDVVNEDDIRWHPHSRTPKGIR